MERTGERNLIDYPDRNELFKVNLFPKIINKNGLVLGLTSISNDKNSLGGTIPFIWVKDRGMIKYNLSSINSTYYTVADLNDSGCFVGLYRTEDNKERPYVCKNINSISDMGEGSGFARHFGKLGYYVTNIQLSAINNSEQLAGVFSYGQYDAQKKKYLTIGQEAFFWDGKLIHVIPLPHRFQAPPAIKLNNAGTVILSFMKPKLPYEDNTTFVWSKRNGIEEIKGFIGNKISDSNTIIGQDAQGHPSIWKNGMTDTISLVDVKDEACTRAIVMEKLIDINSNDQILSNGSLYGQSVLLIIEP